jgi:hypothetical protein
MTPMTPMTPMTARDPARDPARPREPAPENRLPRWSRCPRRHAVQDARTYSRPCSGAVRSQSARTTEPINPFYSYFTLNVRDLDCRGCRNAHRGAPEDQVGGPGAAGVAVWWFFPGRESNVWWFFPGREQLVMAGLGPGCGSRARPGRSRALVCEQRLDLHDREDFYPKK